MKKIFLAAAIVFMTAAAASAADNLKIGYVDIQRAVFECDAGKKAKSDLDLLEKSKRAVIDEKVKNINKAENELNELKKQSTALSPDIEKSKGEEIERLKREVKRNIEEATTELQKKENDLINVILKDMNEVINEFAKEEGYALIIRSEVVLYSKKELELTEKVVKKFNESQAKSKEEPKDESKSKGKK